MLGGGQDPSSWSRAAMETLVYATEISAALVNRDAGVRVVDAAQLRQREHKGLKTVLDVLTPAACVVAGFALAERTWQPAAVAGGLCAGGSGLRLLAF